MLTAQSERGPGLPRSWSVRNLLNQALIVFIMVVVLAPFVLVLSFMITAAGTELARAGSEILAGVARIQQSGRKQKSPAVESGTFASDRKLIVKLMPWTAEFLTAGIAILLWGMSTGKAGSLLARMGARPAREGGPGGQAALDLATLALKLGLPPPKLYIIQCRFPTVFSEDADGKHAMVAVTTGALDLLEDREVAALLAHELSHIANRDGRLEAMLASLSKLMEYPGRMFRQKSSQVQDRGSFAQNLALVEVILSPLTLYVFFVSPVLTGLVRGMVLRRREFHADGEAAVFTGDPEGLASALAKIGGVGTVLRASTLPSLPAHHSLAPRIERLIDKHAGLGFEGIDRAIAKGKQYVKDRPGMGLEEAGFSASQSELENVSQSSVTGRVYQLVAREAVPLFDKPGPGAFIRRRIEPGALLVGFEAPGQMRQVNTADNVFGYVSRDVKLKVVEGVLPQEVYDPETRAEIEEVLRRKEKAPSTPLGPMGLSSRHAWMALGFGAAVFVGTTVLLFVFVGR